MGGVARGIVDEDSSKSSGFAPLPEARVFLHNLRRARRKSGQRTALPLIQVDRCLYHRCSDRYRSPGCARRSELFRVASLTQWRGCPTVAGIGVKSRMSGELE